VNGKSGAALAEISRPAGAVIKLADQGANGACSRRATVRIHKKQAEGFRRCCILCDFNLKY